MQSQRAAASVRAPRADRRCARSRRWARRSQESTSTLRRKLPSCSDSPQTASYTRRSSPSVNGSSRNAVASVVYSILARARSTPSAITRAWSNARATPSSLPMPAIARSSTAQKRASAASDPATSSPDAVKPTYATDTMRMRGSRSGVPYVRSCSRCPSVTASWALATSTPVSSRSSRRAASSSSSSGSTKPPGRAQWPRNGWPRRSTSSTARRPARTVSSTTSTVTATFG